MNSSGRLLRSLIREQIRHSLGFSRKNITEGGGAFPDVNSAVPKAHLNSNIKKALSDAGLSGIKYEIVGNKLKDFFGDIDIAVDAEDLKKHLKITKDVEVWPTLKQFLDGKVTYKVMPGLSHFHILSELIDSKGDPTDAIDPQTHETLPGVSGKIQIDVFIGNLKWMKDTSSGSPASSNYKAVYRNYLLFAIIGNVPSDLDAADKKIAKKYPEKTIKKKILTNFRKGVIERLYYEEQAFGKTGKPLKDPQVTIVDEKITSSADDIYKFFLKKPIAWEKMNSYEELLSQLNSDNFKFPELRQRILDIFKRDLEKNKLEVPADVL